MGWRICGCFFTVSFFCYVVLSCAQITNPSEVSALVAVRRSLVDPMEHLKSWNKGDPCTSNWTGVSCFDTTGIDGHLHVRVLQLLTMNLSGSLAPELGQLTHLQILDFMWNDLSGSIPKEIGNIAPLKLLLLNGNKLSGSLPEELGYLSKLNRLQVDLNQISGPIPKSFSKLSSVRHLHLNNNSISGQIPSELANLSSLLHLLLDNNNLSGYLPPEFSNFADLRILQLDNNNFIGAEIPASYGNLSTLAKLGPRLEMSLKLFPMVSDEHFSTFNISEILHIRDRFTSWEFLSNDSFGPYELLNFILLGPYAYVNFGSQGKSTSKGILIVILLVAITCAVTVTAVVTLLIVRRHARYQHTLSRKHLSSRLCIKIDGVKSFTYKELALATEGFNISTQVGQGGYGNVYKGILSNNTIVAIKRAKEGSLQGKKEFLTEIEMLSRLHHRNLVSLVGYCDEEGEQMLVYEFMPHGTLQDWLFAKIKEPLNFGLRLHIALGSAKGILYLHTEANPPIFHRDIKASNILLDSKLTAKVADFGLSRLAPVLDEEGSLPTHVSTVVKGTPGYIDPEYFLTRKLTDKSDVYSLGVVFLEIFTGKQPISHGKNIVREVKIAHQSGTLFSIIDSRMGCYPSECVERFVALALGCCQDSPEERPSMLDVVRELENIVRMMPETGLDSSEPTTRYFGDTASSSSSSSMAYASRDRYISSNVSGSDLMSGVIPIIMPH